MINTAMIMRKLCKKNMKLYHNFRKTWTVRGTVICLITDWYWTNMVQASFNCKEIRSHIIWPTAKYGRNSLTGDLNNVENIRPILPTIIPVLIVVQNGPISDRRYFCLISYHPSNDHILKYLTIVVISFIILFSEIFI